MKQVMNQAMKAKEVEKHRKAVLRMEMDYELATLFEAIEEDNEQKKKQCKQKLERIRNELLRLKAL
ncbi:hypothetical protein ACIQD3_05820 [Peribacillus loiseleuriae]|uniref:Uncharacterized protein n=1 Tax=Peribacillus loiseleuriae TaxID=1679170 RepID=A0A0K9GRI9_9BACI|nr:hypothetical protein [Peribacillus loiseleuriae]KMY49309.1 hypothetical protein AC625_07035 [Peribacillus loiseleuriae]